MASSLKARGNLLANPSEQLRVLTRTDCIVPFEERMRRAGLDPLYATGITVFQINVGKLCNQTCRHCHVDAGPDRRETMSRETAELCIRAFAPTAMAQVDSTGRAPVRYQHCSCLVEQAQALGPDVIDRCNRTVLL